MKLQSIASSQPFVDRWSALWRAPDVRVMAAVIVLALLVLGYFIATLHEAVARGPWQPQQPHTAAATQGAPEHNNQLGSAAATPQVATVASRR